MSIFSAMRYVFGQVSIQDYCNHFRINFEYLFVINRVNDVILFVIHYDRYNSIGLISTDSNILYSISKIQQFSAFFSNQ